MKKPIATFDTDQQAEDFIASADLTEYDLSGGQVVRFELRPKDETINLRLPEALLNAVRGQVEKAGMHYQRYIRIALEQAVGGSKR
jgi:predicted DNA binding CopG/RHH family protein